MCFTSYCQQESNKPFAICINICSLNNLQKNHAIQICPLLISRIMMPSPNHSKHWPVSAAGQSDRIFSLGRCLSVENYFSPPQRARNRSVDNVFASTHPDLISSPLDRFVATGDAWAAGNKHQATPGNHCACRSAHATTTELPVRFQISVPFPAGSPRHPRGVNTFDRPSPGSRLQSSTYCSEQSTARHKKHTYTPPPPDAAFSCIRTCGICTCTSVVNLRLRSKGRTI